MNHFAKIAEKLNTYGLDGMLLTCEANRFYASGFHSTGTDGVMALSNIAMITGNLGKPGGGVNPLRGQNNVQGSCDMGMWPSLYPGYQRVSDPAVRAKFAAAWGVDEERLSLKEGFKLTDLPHGVAEGTIRAFYNFGEDPLQTEPDTAQMRATLEGLDLLISQDIFMTQTLSLIHI